MQSFSYVFSSPVTFSFVSRRQGLILSASSPGYSSPSVLVSPSAGVASTHRCAFLCWLCHMGLLLLFPRTEPSGQTINRWKVTQAGGLHQPASVCTAHRTNPSSFPTWFYWLETYFSVLEEIQTTMLYWVSGKGLFSGVHVALCSLFLRGRKNSRVLWSLLTLRPHESSSFKTRFFPHHLS